MNQHQLSLDIEIPVNRPEPTGVIHVLLPDFTFSCGLAVLEASAGDGSIIGLNLWHKVTCVWCRSLGKSYRNHAVGVMQGRDGDRSSLRHGGR